ncbi:MAG: AI-2E family transporter, partial [Desulfuromonadales bacterium]|nr:AI-2E family transporter [Desulfuromonadales bacterium]
EEVLAEIGATLRWFLVARAIAMLLVGASTAIALLLLNIPLALLLGVIATLLTFVPYLGPIAAGVPIVLVALLEGPQQALWALIVYTVIQQIEGILFDPLILQRIIRLAPVVTIVSQVLGGVLLGVLGIALATPFAAVMQVFIRRVYREDILGEPRKAGSG